MNSLPWMTIVVMTVVNFIFGHLWFGTLFGKKWQKIHKVDCTDKQKMKQMMKGIWKIMVSELLATFVLMVGLARMNMVAPQFGGIGNALFAWCVFVVPLTISNVVWGGDERKDMIAKIAITVGYRLIPFVIAGYFFPKF